MRFSLPAALAAPILFALPAAADFRAQPNPSAAATGRGGGNTTLNDDSSALFTNPAKLAALETGELRFDPALFLSKLDYAVLTGSGSSGTLENLGGGASLALPLEGGAVFGFGMNNTYGLSAQLPRGGALRAIEPYQLELIAPQFSTGLAFPINDKLALGVTLDLIYADLTFRQIFPWSAVTGLPLPSGVLGFDADGWGVGASAGLSYQIDDRQEIGLRFKAPIDVELDGSTSLSGNPGLPGIAARTSFETEIQLPAEVALGYGIGLTDKLRAGVDVMWLGWSTFDTTKLDAGANNAVLPETSVPRDWQDTWHVGVGFEYDVAENWTLRAGYGYTESAVPDLTFTPTIPDSERHQVNVGVGWHRGRHAVDLGYSHSFFTDRDITSNRNPLLNGHYEFELGIIQLGYRLKF